MKKTEIVWHADVMYTNEHGETLFINAQNSASVDGTFTENDLESSATSWVAEALNVNPGTAEVVSFTWSSV